MDKKFCPYIYSQIPRQALDNTQQITIEIVPQPCLGEVCALHTSCQGKYHPGKIEDRITKKIEDLKAWIIDMAFQHYPKIEKFINHPIVSRLFAAKKPD